MAEIKTEELEKEAEGIYMKTDKEFMYCQDEGEIFNLGYLAGAEPREKRIAELEKENAGLKARLNAINLLTPELQKASKLKKQQLTKATKLLNEFMRISKASDEDFEHDYSELIGEAEQFLKEIKENV